MFLGERNMTMSSISRNEYLGEVLKQYIKSNKKEKGELLVSAELLTGFHRKSLIRRLHRLRSPVVITVKYSTKPRRSTKRGPRVIYNGMFHEALLICWHAENNICAERLQPFLWDLVPKLESCGELRINNATRSLLMKTSISTVARHLDKAQKRSIVPLGTTKPGSLLKSQIAVRRGRWEETNPGWLESDTVTHGGDSVAGQYIFTYDFIDIATGWCELVASMGKGERATVNGFNTARQHFPFAVVGIDSDNGGEYINNHLKRYCERENITFTRSRPYKKNDNAHVEQKNWEAVRKIVGYARFDTDIQLQIMNDLYSGPLRLYLNYFQPTRKRKIKIIDTKIGKQRKSYFEAKTPYQRVMEHPNTSQVTKRVLSLEYDKLNPVQLLTNIRTLIDRLEKTLR